MKASQRSIFYIVHWRKSKIITYHSIFSQNLDRVMKSIFNPPSGCEIENPRSSNISSLITQQTSSYWEDGSGDAGVRYIDDHGHTISEIIFLLRDSYGVYLQFLTSNRSYISVCINDQNLKLEDEITIVHGGSPLTLPRSYFIDRKTAAKIIGTFIDHKNGELPPGFNWIDYK
jgi:hypothetical protein